MVAAIDTHELTKAYGKYNAVDRLTFQVEEGEIFGFLGPNGAGKSTTILMLLGLTEPTSGAANVLGLDPRREPLKVKRQVGYVPENVGFYPDMTADENLRYVAQLNGLAGSEACARIERAMAKVRLSADRNKLVGAFSRGMRQRLGLPEGMASMLKLIRSLSQEEKISVLLCSHLLHQVQEVCDRIGILVQGRLVATGTLEELSGEGVQAEGDRLNLEDIYMRYFQEE